MKGAQGPTTEPCTVEARCERASWQRWDGELREGPLIPSGTRINDAAVQRVGLYSVTWLFSMGDGECSAAAFSIHCI